MIKNQRSICVDNLHGIYAQLKEKENKEKQTKSIRACFCHLDTDGKTLFLNLVQYNSNHVNFLIKPENETQCVNIITNFIHDYIASQLTAKSKELIMFSGKHARIVRSR